MTNKAFKRLQGYSHAHANRPRSNVTSKRAAKTAWKGHGITPKWGKVATQVPLERLFSSREYHKSI